MNWSIEQHIERFNERHSLDTEGQFKQLVSEVGELGEEINKENDEKIAEELSDVIFVAWSICLIENVDINSELVEVCMENLDKSESKEGSKVTKE